jgi:hypothetical protein
VSSVVGGAGRRGCFSVAKQGVDGRDKPGHDGGGLPFGLAPHGSDFESRAGSRARSPRKMHGCSSEDRDVDVGPTAFCRAPQPGVPHRASSSIVNLLLDNDSVTAG